MRVALIGCGYVADYYMQSLHRYPALELAAVVDRDADRLARFCEFHGIRPLARALDAALSDPGIELILNLTNPDSHYEISRAALEAGKHVYSEKPLAMSLPEARQLFELAERKGLQLASAPAGILGETAQSTWKALREQVVGQVRLVYAELDDGLVHRMPYRKWISASGKPWPYKDEFEVGCTLEHAGYYVTWLTAFFGPARWVTAFSSSIYPDKETEVPLDREAPDFSVACIRFASGVTARLTCSIIAPVDRRLRLFGDRGVLEVRDCWDFKAPIRIRQMFNVRRKTIVAPWTRGYPLLRFRAVGKLPRGANRMEFARGPAEVASSILERRPSGLPADYCLHNTEIVLAIQNALETNAAYPLTTSFEPLRPAPWAS
ncbi:MAG TPA: Gfo/Idh/MocA family oxidoreductase [Steroidobacteraceae bacterium]|jgi:predicted dehydrogenase|nr:Gfo/Idh/MocA family oxidoreductase [Steroidobacteraceae bacterium]